MTVVIPTTFWADNSRRLRATRVSTAPPAEFDVLVLDAAMRQSLVCVRSFGRAGLRVALGECFAECDPGLPVLGFSSRFSSHNEIFPSFSIDPDAFATAVLRFVTDHRTSVILPGSDGAIAALLPWREELAARHCTLALATDYSLAVANDKGRTMQVATELGIAVPATIPLTRTDDVIAAVQELGLPAVIKPTTSWTRQHNGPGRLHAAEVLTVAEAIAHFTLIRSAGVEAVAQTCLRGRREGVTLVMVDGAVHASFAHLEHRTSPALGGASVLRESIAMPTDIYNASVRLARAVELDGICEVEFRRDDLGRPFLMEINARIAGPIETAQHAGIDFPQLVWQWVTGAPVDTIEGYDTGIRMRWLRGDLRWLVDNHARRGRPDSLTSWKAWRMFLADFFRPAYYDCFDRRDLGPVRAEWRTTVAATWRTIAANRSPRRRHHNELNDEGGNVVDT